MAHEQGRCISDSDSELSLSMSVWDSSFDDNPASNEEGEEEIGGQQARVHYGARPYMYEPHLEISEGSETGDSDQEEDISRLQNTEWYVSHLGQ